MDETLVKRIMPHSDEAEQSVIGSMLLGEEAVQTASEMLTGEDFYQRQYGLIFDAMTELFHEGKAVDIVTLQNRLREKNAPPEISDMEYVRDLISVVPTSRNIRNYAQIVSDKAILRRLIRVTEQVENECYLGADGADQILEASEKKLFDLFQTRSTTDFVPIRRIVLDALTTIEKASRTKGNVTGIASGFQDLDYMTSGFQNSDLILVAARPSMGKTAFALNVAEYMTLHDKRSVAIFSLEMSKQQLVNRLFAMRTSISSSDLRNGSLKDEEWTTLVEAADTIAASRLIIDDTPGISVREIRSKCRKYKLEFGLDAVMIDYLQLMSGSETRRDASRQQEISDISRSLKALARELNVPVIALSQLSRAPETRTDHRPMLSDLRESGAIEQDADVVMFLYRDDYYNKDSEQKGIAEVIISKQRNGPIGTVPLVWLPEFTKFRSADLHPRT